MHSRFSVRKHALTIALSAVLIFFAADLFVVQIIKGDDYANSMKTLTTYNVTVEAPRGEILDRNGEKLVENKQVNEIVFEYASFPTDNDERNRIILALIGVFEKNSCDWNNTLPLTFVEGEITFSENRNSDISWLKSSSMLNLNDYATAQNCYDALCEKYSLDDYSDEDALKIAAVRYNMVKTEFSARNPYVFADDVPNSVAACVLEKKDSLTGVTVNISFARTYSDATLAPHIIGTVGVISSEEYAEQNDELNEALADENLSDSEKSILERSGYKINSDIGKSGIEAAAEEYLRGLTGEKIVSIDALGNVSETLTVAPETGNTVITTIDKNLQKVAQNALERRLKELSATEGLTAAGAVVVLDVNNADVLASVSYPSYNLDTYYEDYDELAADTASPLWNRAFMSTYAPGSTFKPAMALAGLETGVITANSTFYCDEEFEYKGTTFSCLSAHGSMNVRSSLNYSCNIFYYNLADILGIAKMNEYASLFGLGSKTGVELPEASGVLASIEYRESSGGVWRPGDTIQAAIGQSDNLFTPIQLANYCATIANGGTRYVPHVIKSVVSSDYSTVIMENEAEVAVETGIKAENLETVKLGMYDVANIGTCMEAFANLPVSVAAKTGTSQKLKKSGDTYVKGNNGFIITFGPYENAEIAIAVVIEDLDSGAATAQVAADIYEYYFSEINTVDGVEAVGSLIP